MSADINGFLMDPTAMNDTDLEALLKQAEGEGAGSDEASAQAAAATEANEGDEKDGGASAAGEEAGQQQAQERQADREIDPANAVVLTKDGKHAIPYSTLQQERDARKAAEQLAQQAREEREQLAQQLAELQRQANETSAQAAARQAPDVGDVISTEQLAALKEEAPELAAIMEGLVAQIGSLRERASKAEETASQVAQREAARVATEQERVVENAIANNPKLLFTRTSQPEVFNKIVEFDNFVRQNPDFAGLTLEERLAKSIGMYEASYGQIKVPGFAKAVTSKITEPTPARDTGLPNTLSDIPGGQIPAKNEGDTLLDMSAVDLAGKLMDMTDKDIDKLLARVALT